ncbi:unnamed protein product [Brassica oleracea]
MTTGDFGIQPLTYWLRIRLKLCILDVERTTTSNQDAKKNANLSGQQSFSKCQLPVLHFLFSGSSYEENDVRESALYDEKDEKNLA